jgi:hypothetical protein
VRGNRARNPYIQGVDPGTYEIYAEATDYEPRTETYVVNPGERRTIDFRLNYVQRSGRPELIGFWTAAGAVAGGTLVSARLRTNCPTEMPSVAPPGLENPSRCSSVAAAESATVVAGAALVGGVAGALGATAFVPSYIRDNLALFRIGTAWIGAVEGATLTLAYRKSLTSGWVGGAGGLAAGALTGVVLDDKAPNYGRVAIIQSGAAMGALAGALISPATLVRRYRKDRAGQFKLDGAGNPEEYGDPTIPPSWGIFGGLNVGLGVGLALAYLPDQKVYGPSWQHVTLVDLATAAGAIGGAIVDILGRCIPNNDACRFETTNPRERRRIARSALIGGGVGLVAGWLLTTNYDKGKSAPLERSTVSWLSMPTLLTTGDAGSSPVPGLAAVGSF